MTKPEKMTDAPAISELKRLVALEALWPDATWRDAARAALAAFRASEDEKDATIEHLRAECASHDAAATQYEKDIREKGAQIKALAVALVAVRGCVRLGELSDEAKILYHSALRLAKKIP